MNSLRKAVFLDRDGVINKEKHDYVKSVKELEILYDVAPSIKKLKDNGFLVVVITNQSAVNRGLTTHQDIHGIHSAIQKHLKQYATDIDAFYYCPHRPDENCECRKPKTGLLLKALIDLKIDPQSSWLIGNNDSDILAGNKIGCRSIKITPKINLAKAIQKILNSCNS